MSKRDASGSSLKDQLESVWRQTGKKPKELDDFVELPEIFGSLWNTFLELHSARASNGFSYDPISFTELYSYTRLYDISLEPWEIRLIRRFDSIVLDLQNKQAKAEQAANAKQRK